MGKFGEPSMASAKRMEELQARLAHAVATEVGQKEALETRIPGLTLYRRTEPTDPLPFTCEPSLAVVAQGQKRMDLATTSFLYDRSTFLLTSLDLPAISRVLHASDQEPYLCMVMRLDIAIVRDLASQFHPSGPAELPEGPAMTTGETTPELLDACCRLVELNQSEDIMVMSGLVQREITYRLLTSPSGSWLRALANLGNPSGRLAKAILWVKENFAKPLRVEELAKIAGMGVSTFHQHFRALTSMSPLQYQKNIRLHVARGRMLMEDLDAATAAFEVGYESPSQFTREYRRHFGQPPLRDVRHLRSSGGLAMNLAQNR